MVTVDVASPDDLQALLDLEQAVWIPEQQFSKDNFLAQFKVFPQGMLVVRAAQELAGMFILTRVAYDELPDKSWYAISDGGNLRSAFRADGLDIYGVSLSISPAFRRMGVGASLVHRAIEVARDLGAQRFLVGSRVPEYHLHQKMTIDDYVSSFTDPHLQFYASCGLKVIRPLPEYFSDLESLDYGVLMSVTTSEGA